MRNLLIIFVFLATYINASAQIIGGGIGGDINNQNNYNSQNANDDNLNDTIASPITNSFTLKDYFHGISHRIDTLTGLPDTLTIGHMALPSALFIGGSQIYNKDYWKLPIIYGGLGGTIAGSIIYNKKYHDTGDNKYSSLRNTFIIGAASIYWGTMLDGVMNFKSDLHPSPGRAALYSALLPGLGQAYIGDYWRIPIYYGAMLTSAYFYDYNNKQYRRYKQLYAETGTGDTNYTGNLTADNLKYYRDNFRRKRDYSIIAMVGIYALQIIDANVFAIMTSFDVSDNISMNVEPAMISPLNIENSPYIASYNNNSFGFKLHITF